MTIQKIVDTGVKYLGAKKDLGITYEKTDKSVSNSVSKSKLWKEPNWTKEALKDVTRAYFFMKMYKNLPAKQQVKLKADANVPSFEQAILFLKACFENGEKYALKNLSLYEMAYKVLEYAGKEFMGEDFNDETKLGGLICFTSLKNKKGQLKFLSDFDLNELGNLNRMGFGSNENMLVDNIYHVSSATYRQSKKSFFTVCKNGRFMLDKNNKAIYECETQQEAENIVKTIVEKDWKVAQLLKGISKKIARAMPLDGENRKGETYRENDQLLVSDFMETIGFKGIEFGNWVTQEERQQFLNSTYDGFLDLLTIMKLDAKAGSLYGQLGIAFGSRGNSRASAHFEPDNNLIHITKTKAIGSLAHEFGHAMDYFVTKKLRLPCLLSEVNEKTSYYGGEYDLIEAVIAWKNEVEKSEFFASSTLIDKDKNKAYYATNVELFARCFEQWVQVEIMNKAYNNNFLVFGTLPVEGEELAIYPKEKERETLLPLMGKIVEEISKLLKK